MPADASEPEPVPTAVLTAADDEFHQPDSDDPSWAETCWFTFSVPERRLSGQLYPFFSPNLGVMSAGVYVWDDRGSQLWNCRYAKNFWHLPIPDQPLSDIELAERHPLPGARTAAARTRSGSRTPMPTTCASTSRSPRSPGRTC